MGKKKYDVGAGRNSKYLCCCIICDEPLKADTQNEIEKSLYTITLGKDGESVYGSFVLWLCTEHRGLDPAAIEDAAFSKLITMALYSSQGRAKVEAR